jgi:hypothetical protein
MNQTNIKHFDHSRLDANLQTFQLWSKGALLTANLPRMDAISGIKDKRYYVISSQAVGYASELNNAC